MTELEKLKIKMDKQLDFELNFWKNITNEVDKLIIERTKDWNKNLPEQYYWKACPISIPQLYTLEDDYFQELVRAIEDLEIKYSRNIKLKSYNYRGRGNFSFELYDPIEEEVKRSKQRELDLGIKAGMLGF